MQDGIDRDDTVDNRSFPVPGPPVRMKSGLVMAWTMASFGCHRRSGKTCFLALYGSLNVCAWEGFEAIFSHQAGQVLWIPYSAK